MNTILCLLLLPLISCNSNDSKETTTHIDSVNTAVSNQPLADDPDTTDAMPADGYNVNSTNKETAELVRQALLNEIFKQDLPAMNDEDRKFIMEEIDLNADGQKEIFVGFNGKYYCGSGGCTALLLSHQGKLITRFTVTEYPVIVRPTITNGWRDLLIRSSAAKSAIHIVKWDGNKYPGNPSLQPKFSETSNEKSDQVLNYKVNPQPWFRF